jgi:hypothetical protein
VLAIVPLRGERAEIRQRLLDEGYVVASEWYAAAVASLGDAEIPLPGYSR